MTAAARIAVAVAALAVAGCYDPGIVNGGLTCAADGQCPLDYYCARDRHCWKTGTGPHTGTQDLGGGGGGTHDLAGSDGAPMTPDDLSRGPDMVLLPPAPTGLMTTPASPSNNLHPSVLGNAPAGTIVHVFANGSCSGQPIAMGSASDFAAGLATTVTANTTTTFSANATDPTDGAQSPCSSSIDYVNDTIAPAAPVLTTTNPRSPSATDTMPFIIGTAEAGSTVTLFGDSACAGPTPLGSGSAAVFASTGIQITVTMTTTPIYAHAVDAAGNVSPCTTQSFSYVHDPSTPPVPNLVLSPAGPTHIVVAVTFSGDLGSYSLPGATVSVYTTSDCSGTPIATGTQAQFASGLSQTYMVQQNFVNNFYAAATAGTGRTGLCSSAVSFIEDEVPPNNSGAAIVYDGSAAGMETAWQNATTSIAGNWAGFADNATGIASYDWNVSSTTSCTGDIVASASVAKATSGSSSSVSLLNNKTYYNCVRAWDGAGNKSAWVASSGITVDNVVPDTSSALVRDIATPDVDWSNVTTAMDANWTGFTDAESGIDHYDYNISSAATCTGDKSPTVQLSAATTSAHTVLTLVAGTKYFNCVRAWDVAGNHSNWIASNGVTIDTTAPALGSVRDGSSQGVDIDYQKSLVSLAVNWSGFSDVGGSGVTNYDWAYSLAPDCSTLVGTVGAIGSSGVYTATSLTLGDATKYYDCVRAIDLAGNRSAWVASDGITVENAGPSSSGAVVHDGASYPPDVNFQSSKTTFAGNWSGFSDAVAVDHYAWNVSSSVACSGDVTSGTTTSSSFSASALTLVDGTRYYVCVTAFDGAGNSAGPVHSDGVVIDQDGPVGGVVQDGPSGDASFQKSLAGISANWSGFSDGTGSGIAGYNYALSTHTDCSAPVATQSVSSTSASGSVTISVALSDAVKYYNCIQGIDVLGNPGPWVRSDGVTTDNDPPTGGTTQDGLSGDVAWSTHSASSAFNWLSFTDAGSGIVIYDWQLTTTADCSGTPVAAMSGVGASEPASDSVGGLALADATTYYNCVRAEDQVGNVGPWVASNGFTTDLTKPAGGTVYDGLVIGSEWAWLNDIHGATANWTGFTDGGSGVSRYYYNLSSTSACSGDLYGGSSGVLVGAGTTETVSGGAFTLTQSLSSTYYNCVAAADTAGNVGPFVASSGFRVDAVKPTNGSVQDVTSPDYQWYNQTNKMGAWWGGFADALSGIQYYEWGLSSSASCTTIGLAGPVNRGLSTSITNQTTSTMTEGNIYYNCVRAVDNANNVGSWQPSDGVTIDVTAPTKGSVKDGLGSETAWSNSTTSDPLSWTGFSDSASGILQYDLFLASDAGCTTGLAGFPLLGVVATNSSYTLTGSGLVDGTTYYNCVRAWDKAQNVTTYAVSSGFTIDTDKPTPPSITSQPAGNGQVTVNWNAGSDVGSGIASYDVYACAGSTCTPTFYTNTAALTVTITGLTNCTPEKVQIYSRDKAGNVSATAASVTVSPQTPPVGALTLVPGAGRFEYSFGSVSGATYNVCWGSTNTPSSGGTCLSTSYPSGFIEGQDSSHLVPLTTAYFQAQAVVGSCTGSWSGAQPVNIYTLSQAVSTASSTVVGLGYHVSILGDVNGDGYGDYAVTTGPVIGVCTHTVYVYSGKTNLKLWDTTTRGSCSGADDYFGQTMAGGADLDGDGDDDVLIGALLSHDATHSNAGTWYLYSGKTGSLLCPNVGLGATTGQEVGTSVAFIRDVTGDNVPDILIGAQGTQTSVAGFVQLYTYDKTSGNCVLVTDATSGFTGTINDPAGSVNNLFGRGVAPIGDFDGDGHSDFAVSSLAGNGSIYIFSGVAPFAQVTGSPLTPPSGYNIGVMSLAALGDVDGDGYTDLISSGGPGNSIYSAVVFSGHTPGSVLWKNKTTGSDHYGASTGSLGDINNDGYGDFYVSDDNITVGGVTGAGAIYLYSGKTGQQIYEIDGTVTNGGLGDSVASGADATGDGHPDIIVGNFTTSCSGNSNCGQWWLYSPSGELGLKPGETSLTPFVGYTTPTGSSQTLTATGGSGALTWIGANLPSGGSLDAATGAYSPGGGTGVLDVVAVRDATNREFESRFVLGTRPRIERATGLHTSFMGSGTVSLAWINPSTSTVNPSDTVPVLGYRTATGAWSVTSLPAGTSSYTFSGASATTYRFRVKESSPTKGDSTWSIEVIGSTL